ncbi:hypothetical protein HMPREF3034_00903 [Prevotella sp. DNF00663]|nr:hypothetical protein HMPREF3034_00903 [Prevotella sp. DNF00663]
MKLYYHFDNKSPHFSLQARLLIHSLTCLLLCCKAEAAMLSRLCKNAEEAMQQY